MRRVMWADKVTTPEGYTGTVVEFGSDGSTKVVFDYQSRLASGLIHNYYDRDELLVGFLEKSA